MVIFSQKELRCQSWKIRPRQDYSRILISVFVTAWRCYRTFHGYTPYLLVSLHYVELKVSPCSKVFTLKHSPSCWSSVNIIVQLHPRFTYMSLRGKAVVEYDQRRMLRLGIELIMFLLIKEPLGLREVLFQLLVPPEDSFFLMWDFKVHFYSKAIDVTATSYSSYSNTPSPRWYKEIQCSTLHCCSDLQRRVDRESRIYTLPSSVFLAGGAHHN